MKSITIHNLDSELAVTIEEMARTTGLSKNKLIKKLLRKALGIGEEQLPKRDLSKFFGVWTKEEGEEFDKAIQVFGEIDEEDWQ